MALCRLSDNDKQELVGRYKAGEQTVSLAKAFGCSPNTVTRTVKALLPADEYKALKANRQKGVVIKNSQILQDESEKDFSPSTDDSAKALADEDCRGLVFDDVEDFAEDREDKLLSSETSEQFQEIVPLTDACDFNEGVFLQAKPLEAYQLPPSVYMLVDKLVELDARPLREFPELGHLDDAELDRQGLMLYANPRAAKRQCGRSQRVIKVPDTSVFDRTISYLLARGITRLVMDGNLISLDYNQN